MVIRGRSRSNGAQLANYLLNSKENDRARIIDVRGTARPDSLKQSLLEMSLSSELTKHGDKGLYHAQINPAIGEDRPMTHDDWLKAADILEERLGFAGQKRALVLHEKKGRLHGHIVWERYDHDTGKLRSDSHNFKKHDQARAEIEQALGHARTMQKREKEPTHKERLTELWQQHPDGRGFIDAAGRAGYYIAQGNDRRPYRVITPDGQSLDLMRQIARDIKNEVRDSIKPIRADLWPEADALRRVRHDREQAKIVPDLSDLSRDVSDSQDLAAAMIDKVKRETRPATVETKIGAYSFTIKQPLAPSRQPDTNKIPSENLRDISNSQDIATAMIERYRQSQADQKQRERDAREQLQAANDNSAEIERAEIERLKEQQRQIRERGRSRGGYSR